MATDFLEEIKAIGGNSVTKCYQCGSCTANCPLTARIKAFPRRTIRLVQLGLRERALRSPDIWLCSGCTTCRAACPRNADPGEIMAALRRCAYTEYSCLPGPTRKLNNSSKLVAALAVSILAVILLLTLFTTRMADGTGAVNFADFLPFSFVDAAGLLLGVTVAVGIALNGLTMWRMLSRGSDDPRRATISQRLRELVNVAILEVGLQRSLRKCNTGRLQWVAHLSVVIGFAGAALTTMAVYSLNDGGRPFPLDNPIKILGNASAALLIFGGATLIWQRAQSKNTFGRLYFQDSLFLVLLFVVAITGTFSEVGRLTNSSLLAYSFYSIHLASATLLLGLAPYTKFAHAIYRPLAMYFAKLRGWPD